MCDALRRVVLVITGMLFLAGVSGCATIGDTTPQVAHTAPVNFDWSDASASYASLLALRDAEQPSRSPLPVPRLRGLDTDHLTPLSEDDPASLRAHLSLDDALLAARQLDLNPAPSQPIQSPTEGALVRARRLYTSGISKLFAGDNPAAARDLAAAAQIDPTAPAPWLRLAEAQARLGQVPASLLSRKKAVDLGSTDAISLAILGIQATQTAQHELAAHYLARCLDAQPRRVDPLLQQVALVRIATPLRQLGYLRASIAALQEGLVLPRQLRAPTRFGKEASDIARRASDLWLQIGDTACRLGDDKLAERAYATAAGMPSVDPGAILARRAYILLRSGQRAAVGLLVLDSIAQHEGRADARDLRLFALLTDDKNVGPLVARALGDLDASLPELRTASTETALVLARAAVSGSQESEALLLARAMAAPGDRRVIDAIFALPGDDASREKLSLQLVNRVQSDAEIITDALLAWHSRPVALLESLPESLTGRLVRIHVLGNFHWFVEAASLQLGTPEAGGDALTAAFLASRGLAAASAGAWDIVDNALDSLIEHPIAAARLCRGAQRYAKGLALLGPVLSEDPTLSTLLLASELAMAVGDMEQALQMLDRAVALDPYDERPYEGLVNVYQALGNQQKTAETIRELRARVPSSHLLRWVNAQEEARRGLLDQAERSLRELAEDAPTNGNALRMLLQIWTQRARVVGSYLEKTGKADTPRSETLEDAEHFLLRLTQSLPVSPELIVAHARLLHLLSRDEDAEQTLREGLESRPSPVISRELEGVLYESGRTDEAFDLAMTRFTASGRGIETSLEHAEVLARADRWSEVSPLIKDALPEAAHLTMPQRGTIFSLVSSMASRAAQPTTPTARADAIALFRLIEDRGIDLTWQSRYALWALISTAPETTDAQIAEETDSLLAAIDSMTLANSIIGDSASRLLIPIETLDQARGQVAYQLAGSLQGSGREGAALLIYRESLRYYPEHAWSANNLGYFLLERHENLDEAERLLELAYKLRPDQSSIADSLGWLRYKFGQYTNESLPDGSIRVGAVSMLIAASGLPGGSENPTIHDHLGDALWRAG